MAHAAGARLSLLLAAAVATAPPPPAAGQAAGGPGLADRVARARAEGLFAAEEVAGELPVEAAVVLRGFSPEGHQQGTLEVLVDLSPLAARPVPPAAESWFRVSLVVATRGEGSRVVHAAMTLGEAAAAEWWSFEAAVELPGTMRDAAVVVEEPFSGLWGAAVAEVVEERLEVPAGAAFSVRPGVWRLTGEGEEEAPVVAGGAGETPAESEPATGGASRPSGEGSPPGPATAREPEPAASAPDPEPEPPRSSVLRILPPRGRRLAGTTRFETLVSDPEVARVVFFLDGDQVAEVTKEPFDARIDLAGPGTPQTVRAVAWDATGKRLGEDLLTVNDPVKAFRVRLVEVAGRAASGSLSVAAEVDVPSRSRLDRLELYWNEELAARLTAPPFRAEIATPGATGQDFVRAAAFLDDGTVAEDVRLLTSQGVVETVEVNLVELFVVATDRDGRPVEGLGRDAFAVRQGGRPVRLERVTYAEDVPLSLGLVIDTSASMQFIMLETRQAATGFLSQVLSPGDRAFVVDFGTRPRLRQRSTGDLMELVESFKGMRAEGATAMYDAIIFSLLEFTDGPGRRALVMLTDGDDYKSRFGANRAIQDARRMGVPVYLVVLCGPPDVPIPGRRSSSRGAACALRGSSRMEIEAVTAETGGRLYFAQGIDQLPAVYAEIDEELRSQYLLTYYAEEALTEEDRRSIDVEVRRRGVEARTVVGAR